ncbi:MAG: type II toxin-antitoxin system PemK/MazF family toxin [Nanoarchaeota archaeon]|nr:type II toxin-antitoxin system PemK/MazF family toxin [Nanoarchaeota archaeon]
MKLGKMHNSGDVVLAAIQFSDTYEVKKRPALVLFEDHNNIVVAGITSNTGQNGILITRKDGAIKDSVIKLNYIFTISSAMIKKRLFTLSKEKKKKVFEELSDKLSQLV